MVDSYQGSSAFTTVLCLLNGDEQDMSSGISMKMTIAVAIGFVIFI
jgi:hypothetical protein